jgi:uncharacterized protein involved in exopolysaccharide biosynthesis
MTNTETAGEVRLSVLIAQVLRKWRLIARVTVVALLIGVVIYVVKPKRYAAEITLVPAQASQSDVGLLMSQLDLPFPLAMRPENNQERLVGAIARSRSLADSVVQQLGGASLGEKTEKRIRAVLKDHTEFRTNEDGSIRITVRDREAERAARIANAFPGVLNTIMTQLAANVTERKLQNLRSELGRAMAQLQSSEERLVDYKRTGAAPVIEAQATQTVEAAGQLQRMVMEKEVEIAQMRRSMTPENPQLRAAVAELASLRQQLNRLTGVGASPGQVYVPMREAPGIKAVELRLEHEYARDAQIYNTLAAAIAQAQIDMNDRLPIVTVLDAARVPVSPAGPSLPVTLVMALVLGVLAGLIGAGLSLYWAHAQRDPEGRQLHEAWSQVKDDIRHIAPAGLKRGAKLKASL